MAEAPPQYPRTATGWLPLGEIVAAHGLRGLVRVRCYNPESELVRPGLEVALARRGERRPARVERASWHGRMLLVAFAGVSSRERAQALVGSRVEVATADLPAPGPDEFYYHEVVGFTVETVGGERVGSIRATFPTGGNHVWVVVDGRRERLVPVIADVVRSIDRSRRRVVIDPLPGLLDL